MIPPRVTAQLRRALGHTVNHRVRIMEVTLSNSATDTVSLLQAADAPDYDLATDGTNVAQCETGARIVGMNLKLVVLAAASGSGKRTEMLLFRDEDNAVATNFTPSNLFNPDVSVERDDVRQNTVWYDLFVPTAQKDGFTKMIRGFKGMRRIRLLKENDRLKINFVNGTVGTDFRYIIVGTITTVK